MKDDQIMRAGRPIEISGKTIEVYPLRDRDLEELTQWIRYKLKKDARMQAEFAESADEKEKIIEEAHDHAFQEVWFSKTGITLLLNQQEGLVETIYRMADKKWKKDWFQNKFGTLLEHTDEQLENRKVVQNTFLEQNTLEEKNAESKETTKTTKSKKK